MRIDALDLLETIGHLNVRLAVNVGRQMPTGVVSIARYRILRFIQAREPTTAGAIRSFFGLAPRTVTEALDSLERDGLIRRDRGGADKRVVKLVVTPTGREALDASRPILAGAAENAFGNLDPHERELLLNLINRVLDRLG